ncbi:MAG: response regulator [Phycisphaerales bacterium]|jgi:YesN/AraC family two-component response regulator|nr:response regulator [Phycisphaerales bacterium]
MKILIVEDNVAARKLFVSATRKLGHEVESAEDGIRAWEMVQAYQPDLVISDIEMPGMDGLQLLRLIQESNRETIVMIVTGYGSEQYVKQALRDGASNFLSKPVRFAELEFWLSEYQRIVEQRAQHGQVTIDTGDRTYLRTFENYYKLVPQYADVLLSEVGERLDNTQKLSVRLGLVELIMNSIEHGNLGITQQEKSDALNANRLAELYEQRLLDPNRFRRVVTVHCSYLRDHCEWLICDEGEGFDFTAVPDPLKAMETGEFAFNGRGIFLSRFQFDEMEYLGSGNRVRVRKNILSSE